MINSNQEMKLTIAQCCPWNLIHHESWNLLKLLNHHGECQFFC